MSNIRDLYALEILDSRGRPTIKTTCTLASGISASASVPSGRSTGAAEALELRDGNPLRYQGKGCLKAVGHVNTEILNCLKNRDFSSQQELDGALIALDGTDNKRNLGANAILSVSISFARAVAKEQGQPLYRAFSQLINRKVERFPRLTINLFSGGRHAGKQIPIQDVLIVPSSPESIDHSLVMMNNIYQAAAEIGLKTYGMRLLTADEGGLAPPFPNAEAMLEAAVTAISNAGYRPGEDAHLALDVAASHFYRDGSYYLDETPISSSRMIERLQRWCADYPIVSIEDGLYEDDWDNWPLLQEALGSRILILGDDLLCTNPSRIDKAIAAGACNALLLKVNQIGTLTEAARACRMARDAGWLVTISVRSGETEDDWAADLAVGWSGDQFKNGSVTQSERLAKYNRLLEIENQNPMPIVSWPS
ncbi:MAG: enolase [Desulfocapsaceae bacterium]|jgi:enolase|nr:enolase [Desulfocapsaceae bacterium]